MEEFFVPISTWREIQDKEMRKYGIIGDVEDIRFGVYLVPRDDNASWSCVIHNYSNKANARDPAEDIFLHYDIYVPTAKLEEAKQLALTTFKRWHDEHA
jgi:hypothetical protein